MIVKRLTNEKFIEKSKKIHGNRYDYSLVRYINISTKIDIICPEHGLFSVYPKNHYTGSNCSKCRNEILSKKFSLTKEEFIKKGKEVHGDKYDYTLVEYINSNTKVNIICLEHGMFKQTPNNHMRHGCLKCGKDILSDKFSLTKEEFIKKAKEVHGDKYNYDNSSYYNYMTKVEIICLKHGIFKQTPNSHLSGQGCPTCRESKGEKRIREYLVKRGIVFNGQKKFDGCINKSNLLFDFYLPNRNILIEYDGKQHFEVVKIFGGFKGFKERQINDKLKNEFSIKNNIHLIRIPYYEYNSIEKILENKLENEYRPTL